MPPATSSSSSTPSTFPFLRLPSEIRNLIYLLVVTSPTGPIQLTLRSTELSNSSKNLNFPHGLLLANRQIHNEVGDLYFKANDFDLLLSSDCLYGLDQSSFMAKSANRVSFYLQLKDFTSRQFQDRRRLIRRLRIRKVNWDNSFGSVDRAWVRRLAPLLEDMVANGSLRELDVWMPEWERPGGEDRGWGGSHTRNNEVLLRLCEDSRLEKARLVGFPRLGIPHSADERASGDKIRQLLDWDSWATKPKSGKLELLDIDVFGILVVDMVQIWDLE